MEVRRAWTDYVAQFEASGDHCYDMQPADYPAGKALLESSPETQAAAVADSFPLAAKFGAERWQSAQALWTLRTQLLRRKLRFTAAQAVALAEGLSALLVKEPLAPDVIYSSGSGVVAALERYAAENGGLPESSVEPLDVVRRFVRQSATTKDLRKLASRLEQLLETGMSKKTATKKRSGADAVGGAATMDVRKTLEDYAAEFEKSRGGWHNAKPADCPSGQALLNSSPETQAAAVLESFPVADGLPNDNWQARGAVWTLRNQILRRKLPFTAAQVDLLAKSLLTDGVLHQSGTGVVSALERHAKEQDGLPEGAAASLRAARRYLPVTPSTGDERKLASRMDELMKTSTTKPAADTQRTPDDEAASELVRQYLAETERLRSGTSFWALKGNEVAAGRTALAAKPAEQVAIVLAGVRLGRELDEEQLRLEPSPDDPAFGAYVNSPGRLKHHEVRSRLNTLLRAVLRKSLPFGEADLHEMLDWLACRETVFELHFPTAGIAKAVENFCKENAAGGGLRAAASRAADTLRLASGKTLRPFAERLTAAVAGGAAAVPLPISPGEAWSDAALADIAAMDAAAAAAWSALLNQALTATTGKPAAKWLKAAEAGVAAVGPERFAAALVRWFPLVDKPRTVPLDLPRWGPDPNLTINDRHADILKGLVWASTLAATPELARALGALAVSSYRKIPQLGPRLTKVGNAAVWALGNLPGRDGIGQLAYLKVKVKFGTAQKEIDKALTAAAAREGLPREELEEMAVPAYGLTGVGVREEPLGDFTARLTVGGVGKTELTWLKSDGKPQKSVPAAVKADHAEELKELKAAAKDIEKMLPAQRDRIDGLYLDRKSWPLETWRERYLDHPLVGVVARHLIWRFTTGDKTVDALWFNHEFLDVTGKPLAGFATESGAAADTTVQLWHPIGEPVETVLAWRRLLEDRRIRQPFKQAHREVYLLTDAERRTETYSNRFAAHILKQHQFHALCAVRGWKNKLRLMVDDEYPPACRNLPAYRLRAEYWIEGIGDDYGTHTNEAGTYLYLATDQVRFYRSDAGENYAHAGGGGYGPGWRQATAPDPLRLEEIDPLVFSEILRDVDLFVGVASVGNDPAWADGGHTAAERDYWTTYSFGDLSATAQTRKAVLERIIPRLKIADRCSFSDKFLVVRGDLRTYKIHLGSGNILMEPNDQYLCIVPKSSVGGGDDKVFLPFEGDRTLSVVLSKALLLADDKKIADTTITRQIKP